MNTVKGTRGRPKGTGINDRDILLRIAGIIVDNPDIKRTTAIKRAGIDNPSTVRRLRDKFAADADKLIAEARASRTAAPEAKPRRKPAAPAPVQASASATGTAADQINIEALVTGILGQALGVKADALSASPILALLREQMRLVDLVLPILRTQIQTAARLAQAA